MIDIVDILKGIIKEVSDEFVKLTNNKYGNVEFMCGHPITIINELSEREINTSKQWPLFAIYRPFEEPSKYNSYGIFNYYFPKCVICTWTEHSFNEDQRMIVNFNPILYPILDIFNKKMDENKQIFKYEYNKIDVPYYSETNQRSNTFNERVDGIIIKDLYINLLENGC